MFLFLPFSAFGFGEANDYIKDPPPNPSAAYCEDLGYTFSIKETPAGQMGICKVSENKEVPAWGFLRGEEAQGYSYCSKAGYEKKVVDNPEKCGLAYKPGFGCLVCVLADGSEVEVASLLKKEKTEGLSGRDKQICQVDGKCITPENYQNCPQDCIVTKKATPKDNIKNIVLAIIGLSMVIVIIIIAYYLLVRKKEEENDNNY